MSANGIAFPGQIVGTLDAAQLGAATHVHGSNLCASIAGPVTSQPNVLKGSSQSNLSIIRSTGPLLPEVGTVVIGKITRTQSKQANIAILALGSAGEHVCGDALPGLIRQQDIRATEIDKVKVSESFRVGDIVRAVVISLGDERSYYLSTAKNELGVIMATSEWGNQMYPISWKEYQDPTTGLKEMRKVAKPV
jgi:exosome complex component CSL4